MSEKASGEAVSSSDSSDKEFSCPGCGKGYGSRGGLKYHMKQCCPEEMSECEICSDLFMSEHGVKTHKAHSHGISKVEMECESCGSTFKVKQYRKDSAKYCSYECSTRDTIAGWNAKEHPELECERCGDTYTVPPHQVEYSRYCSRECQHGPRPTVECEQCGKEYDVPRYKEDKTTYCSWGCKNEAMKGRYVGEKSPRWKGGDVGWYGPNWFPQRRKARIRDQSRCQLCGATPLDTGEEMTVHHIQKIRYYKNKYDAPKWWEIGNRLNNLMCVCRSCHHIAERMSPLRPH